VLNLQTWDLLGVKGQPGKGCEDLSHDSSPSHPVKTSSLPDSSLLQSPSCLNSDSHHPTTAWWQQPFYFFFLFPETHSKTIITIPSLPMVTWFHKSQTKQCLCYYTI
jgi:hypothetical protein